MTDTGAGYTRPVPLPTGSPKIAPSILNADFARLGEVIAEIEDEVDLVHVDVMDGHFVPNLSFGIPIVESLRAVTDLYFDCHLMVTNPVALFEPLAAAGANLVTIHAEVHPDPTDAARIARELGLDFGLVINPPTPFEAVEPFVELADLVLVMSVHPGFGGQSFISDVLTKVESAKNWVDSHGLVTDIEIDGGITAATARLAADAGATVFVAGTAILGAADPVESAREIRKAASGA
ncbi:ribulose-phosphate 3-epimerase [bacterium]|nr:ribulose-phosphate 3-epimerase [bacterium]